LLEPVLGCDAKTWTINGVIFRLQLARPVNTLCWSERYFRVLLSIFQPQLVLQRKVGREQGKLAQL
jgi:hypothetical protein